MSEPTKLISFSHHKQSQGSEISAIEKFKHLIVISPLLKSVETPSEGTCQPEKRDARWPTSTPPPSSIESDRIELNWLNYMCNVCYLLPIYVHQPAWSALWHLLHLQLLYFFMPPLATRVIPRTWGPIRLAPLLSPIGIGSRSVGRVCTGSVTHWTPRSANRCRCRYYQVSESEPSELTNRKIVLET